MPTRQTLNLNKLQLSYLEWKQAEKPLIALHGLADHGLVWSSLGDYLAPEYHLIAPDLRGHGESSKPAQGYQFVDYIEDLEGLMNHLGWKDAHILGHSWGAKLAAIWATQHPERFRSLILVDPFFIDKMPSWFNLTFPVLYKVLPFLKIMETFPSYEAAENLAKGLKQYQGWTPLQQQIFQQGMEQKPDGTWSSKFIKPARDEIFEDVMRVAGLTQSLNIPTLFIKPKAGLNRTQWQLKPYKTYLKNLKIEEVPGNHWAFLVEPEPFNKTIKEFLNQIDQG
ncbi:alpha/beta hydrolase fold protein [Gloeothece citriformis PCC 7424]|uniref:Alpha/beta hydrolase fold protein n=1 Tax=Gloeothece citriformis (strain PCC 7424) TaxID=65393 RepID=B7K7X7_GLOC7|nr:alpha/beta hydrolase [Gloeothece citriformis]ACK71173.1 alpha/beta hydrolase fold protein [Gloeothece citriformis PCC 7424]